MSTDFGLDLPSLRTVDLSGPVHYREYDGPPDRTFVLIHGLGGTHLNWWKVAPGLARLGRVLVPDLAGFGLTPRAGRGSDLRSNRLLLSRFLRVVDAEPAVLVGNSMGGALALLQAALEPTTVDAIVLSSGALPRARGAHQPLVSRIGFQLYRPPVLGEMFGRWRVKGMSAERTTELGFWLITADPDSLDEQTWSSQLEMTRMQQADPDALPAFLQAARSLMDLGSHPRMSREIVDRATCPVLALHGGADKLVPLGWAQAAVRGHAGWRLEEFPGVGHAIQLEAPDAWLSAVSAWVSDSATGDASGVA